MISTLLLTDGYKLDHRTQYPTGTSLVYSTFTPRGSRFSGINESVFFGLQLFLKKYFIDEINATFFNRPVEDVVTEYQSCLDSILGPNNGVGTEHIRALHNLGYLPLEIRAIPEGMSTPMRVAQFTVHNTHKDFGWLTNYFETAISAAIWQPCCTATIAKEYRKIMDKWMLETDKGNMDFVDWQAHDFSMRGMSSLETSTNSALGHVLSFKGTDVFPVIPLINTYYGITTIEFPVMYEGTLEDAKKEATKWLEEYLENIYEDCSDIETEPKAIYEASFIYNKTRYLMTTQIKWSCGVYGENDRDSKYTSKDVITYGGCSNTKIELYNEVIGGTIKASEHAVMCANAAGSENDEYASYKRLITEVYPSGPIALVSDTYDFYKVLTDTVPRLKEEILARDGSVCFRGDSADPADILCGKLPKSNLFSYWRTDKNFYRAKEWLEEFDKDENDLDCDDCFLEDNIVGQDGLSLNTGRDCTPDVEDGDTIYFTLDGRVFSFEVYIKSCVEATWCHCINEVGVRNIQEVIQPIIEPTPESKGAVEILWDIFGGAVNDQGYKVLDPHVKASFGEAINLDKANEIFKRLADKGFASSNIVLGVGSFGYGGAQVYNNKQVIISRDTFSCAIKAVYTEVESEDGTVKHVNIFKDPKTDNGTKKSAKGKVMVYRDKAGVIRQKDECTWEEARSGLLEPVFKDGRMVNTYTLKDIRKNIKL